MYFKLKVKIVSLAGITTSLYICETLETDDAVQAPEVVLVYAQLEPAETGVGDPTKKL